jgi:hypothetical protein
MCCLNLRLAWGTRTCTKCAFEKSCYLFLVCFSQQWTARNNFVVLQLWYNFLLICIVCHSKITLKSFRILVTPTETNAAKFGYIFVIWLLSSWVHCSAVWCDHIHVIKLMCWLLWRHPHLCNCCHIVCARYPSSLFVNIPPAPPPPMPEPCTSYSVFHLVSCGKSSLCCWNIGNPWPTVSAKWVGKFWWYSMHWMRV